jgi:hypothetical protein
LGHRLCLAIAPLSFRFRFARIFYESGIKGVARLRKQGSKGGCKLSIGVGYWTPFIVLPLSSLAAPIGTEPDGLAQPDVLE